MKERAEEIAIQFEGLRDDCEHYTGIKEDYGDCQCEHPDMRGTWCAMFQCPYMIEAAEARGLN